MSKQYEVIMYAFIEADSLEEAEELYEQGEYFLDYHEIVDYDDITGAEVKYDQWDIEEMRKSNVSNS